MKIVCDPESIRGYRRFIVDPYAKPDERKVRDNRPKVAHLPPALDKRTRQDRQREKQAVIDERRAIKKAARRALKQQMLDELKED